MRLATYSQRSATTRASSIAVVLLIVTILQGSSGTLSLFQHFSPALIPVVTLIWFFLYTAAFMGLMHAHGINWIFWLSRYRFLLVILLMGSAASIAWSIDPPTSMQRTVHLIGSSIVAIYFGFMIPLHSIIRVFSWILGIILFASILSVFLIPELGIENYEGARVWKGILSSKNTLGFWAAAGVLLYLSQLSNPAPLSHRFGLIVMAIVSLITLYFCRSATSLLALIVAGALCLYFYISIRFKLGFIRMAVMAILLTSLVVMALLNIDTAELVGRSGDLTGRGEVWKQTWQLILQKPMPGYGYGSIWNPNDATLWIQQSLTDFTWVVFHAHNGFLQVASEIGIPLSCIALLWVVQQVIEILYCQYDRQQLGVLFVLGFVVAFLISNYSEARFLMNRELYWIFFIALPISMLRQVNVVLAEEENPDFAEDSAFDRTDMPPASAAWATDSEQEIDTPLENHGGSMNEELAPSLVQIERFDGTLDEEMLNSLAAEAEDTAAVDKLSESDSTGEATSETAEDTIDENQSVPEGTEEKNTKDELDRLFERDEAADTLSMNFDPYSQFNIEDRDDVDDDGFDRTLDSAISDLSNPHIDILLDDPEHPENN